MARAQSGGAKKAPRAHHPSIYATPLFPSPSPSFAPNYSTLERFAPLYPSRSWLPFSTSGIRGGTPPPSTPDAACRSYGILSGREIQCDLGSPALRGLPLPLGPESGRTSPSFSDRLIGLVRSKQTRETEKTLLFSRLSCARDFHLPA